jgi:hypothetical protein
MIIKSPDCGSIGLNRDQSAWELAPPAWSDAQNFHFTNGFAERTPGHLSSFGTALHAPYGMYSALDSSGNRYVVYPGLLKVSAVSTTTHYNITRLSGGDYSATADGKWTGGVLNGVLVINSGAAADDPQFWVPQAGGNLAALTNWPASTKCAALRLFKNYLVAMDVTKSSTRYPYQVMWSAAATPGTLPVWTAAATNDAGETDLGDSDDYVIDALQLSDVLTVYREKSTYLMRYVGGQYVFQFSRVPNSAGMLANNCAAAFPGGHVVFGSSDVYVFDGTGTQSIVDGRMRRWLFANIDATNFRRSFVVANPRRSEAWIAFPSSGASSCDTALIWNWKDNTLGIRDMPNVTSAVYTRTNQAAATTWATASGTWDSQTETWSSLDAPSLADNALVLGSTDTKLHIVDAASTFDGTAITALLERSGIALGDAQRVKFVRSVWPRIDGTPGDAVEVTVGTQMSIDEAVSWGSAQTYTIGTSRKVDVNRSGRFMAIRLRSSGGSAWKIRSFDVDIQPQGLW